MVEVEIHRVAGSQADAATGRRDGAVIGDPRRDQRNEAAVCCVDGALICHRAASADSFEVVLSGEEVGIRDTQRRGHQAADIDLGARGEEDAAGIADEHVAVGGHAAEDRRTLAAQHPVEYDGRGTGLDEVDVGLAADVEAVPVDDGAAGRLGHIHSRTTANDPYLSCDNLSAAGQCVRCRVARCRRATAQRKHCSDDRRAAAPLAAPAGKFRHGDPGRVQFAPDQAVAAIQCGVLEHGYVLWRIARVALAERGASNRHTQSGTVLMLHGQKNLLIWK